MDTRTWGQRIRDRGLGDSLRHRGGLAPRSRLGLLGGAVGLLAVVGVLFAARKPIGDILAPPSEPVSFTVELAGTTRVADDGDLQDIMDGSPELPLSLMWEREPDTEVCAAQNAYVLKFQFTDGTTPRRMWLHISRTDPQGTEAPENWPGPRLISLRGDGGCDGPDPTGTEHGWIDLDVDSLVGESTWIELFIHARWIDQNAEPYPIVAIGEIEFLR